MPCLDFIKLYFYVYDVLQVVCASLFWIWKFQFSKNQNLMKIQSFHNDMILMLIMSTRVFLLHCTHRKMQKNMINIECDRSFLENTIFRNFIKEESASHLTSSWLWCQRRCLNMNPRTIVFASQELRVWSLR